jgi:uncharacterized protein YprB with RNaseH-like and TPR domain
LVYNDGEELALRACLEAYLDIETTGLSFQDCQITVVGVHLCRGKDSRFVQLVGDDISVDSLLEVLAGVEVIYTYNGSRFDLPFIRRRLGVDLAEIFRHYDLMYDCWRNNLRGGFKAVERQLGIPRRLAEMNGYEAVRLWWRYVNNYDRRALAVLLEYNREDVINLKALRERLEGWG